jgi:hypothetical protein
VKRIVSLLLVVVILVSFVWFAVPVFLIYPFRTQSPQDIAIAYTLRSRAEVVTLLLLALGAGSAAFLWTRRIGRKSRVLTGLALTLLAGIAFLARQNHFEWMFGPLPEPRFVDAAEATHVSDDDLVLGVRVGDEARAYPVRALAYHHVVNDVVANEPIVATY